MNFIYNRIFSLDEEGDDDASLLHIIVWWELKRIPYNIFVGVLGLLSLILFYFFISHSGQLEPGEDAVEPILLIFAPILINIAYTFGWLFEIIFRKIIRVASNTIGITLFKLGIVFSIAVIFFPSVVWGIIYLSNL